MKWSEVQKLHAGALSRVVATIEKVAPEKWTVPRAEGKWSPAEIAEHLIIAYDVFTGEVNGAAGMKVRTQWWQRALWRVTILPKLLGGTPFPPNIPAPREVRPSSTRGKVEAIEALRERGPKLDAAVVAALGSGRKVTHAYLGKLSLTDGVLFCARHLQHHEKQLSV